MKNECSLREGGNYHLPAPPSNCFQFASYAKEFPSVKTSASNTGKFISHDEPAFHRSIFSCIHQRDWVFFFLRICFLFVKQQEREREREGRELFHVYVLIRSPHGHNGPGRIRSKDHTVPSPLWVTGTVFCRFFRHSSWERDRKQSSWASHWQSSVGCKQHPTLPLNQVLICSAKKMYTAGRLSHEKAAVCALHYTLALKKC